MKVQCPTDPLDKGFLAQERMVGKIATFGIDLDDGHPAGCAIGQDKMVTGQTTCFHINGLGLGEWA